MLAAVAVCGGTCQGWLVTTLPERASTSTNRAAQAQRRRRGVETPCPMDVGYGRWGTVLRAAVGVKGRVKMSARRAGRGGGLVVQKKQQKSHAGRGALSFLLN